MISELDSKGGAEIVSMFNKLTEVIRALNAMEAASTSDNSRVMPCPKFIPGANCEIYRTNRCSTIRSCLITVTA